MLIFHMLLMLVKSKLWEKDRLPCLRLECVPFKCSLSLLVLQQADTQHCDKENGHQ